MKINSKNGFINIVMPIGIVVIILILLTAFLTFYQINTMSLSVKNDLAYICQNAILSFEQQDLTYSKYSMNLNEAKNIIQELINKNYASNEKIKNIEIIELKYYQNEVNSCTKGKSSILHIVVEVQFETIVNISNSKVNRFKIHDDISLALMNYGGNSEK